MNLTKTFTLFINYYKMHKLTRGTDGLNGTVDCIFVNGLKTTDEVVL